MSFIHYLFLGHFDHNGKTVRFSKSPSDSVYRPVVLRPIDRETIQAVLHETNGMEITDVAFPEDWQVWLEGGYLVCEKYTKERKVVHFITRLVERTSCDIYDVSGHCDITLKDWLEVASGSGQQLSSGGGGQESAARSMSKKPRS